MTPRSPKLGKGGIMTVADQFKAYAEMFGEEKAREQMRLQKLASRKCICDPPAKMKFEGFTRVIHTKECPKFKPWMEEAMQHAQKHS